MLSDNRMTKGIAVFLAVVLLTGAVSADTYRCITNGEAITLDSSWKDNPNPHVEEGWYLWEKDKKTEEGDYLIAKASEFLYLSPLFSTREDLRYYQDVIYTGDTITCYRDVRGESPFYAGSQKMKFGYGIGINSLYTGADIITAKGGLYSAGILTEEHNAKTYKELYDWIAEAGEKYLLGYYDSDLTDKGFLLCVFTDEAVSGKKVESGEMLLGQWNSSAAYPQVFLNENSDLYRQVRSARTVLQQKKKLSYAHAMGLPTDVILGGETVTVTSDTEQAEIVFFQDGGFHYSAPGKEREEGTWTFADGLLILAFADGTEATGQGDPMVLNVDGNVFTLRVLFAAGTAEEDTAGLPGDD